MPASLMNVISFSTNSIRLLASSLLYGQQINMKGAVCKDGQLCPRLAVAPVFPLAGKP